jgi:hypothetical protein
MVICATGVYGKTEHEFFDSLVSENITLFVDIRQRRGMRGKNIVLLIVCIYEKLKKINIKYLYLKDLAPTSEIRQEQKG